MLFVFLFLTIVNSALFAGNGLKTYSKDILHGRTIEQECTTYDDCYELLCYFLSSPIYIVDIKPNEWNGDCASLGNVDDRILKADLEAYHNNIYNGTYSSKTNSGASILLCRLAKNTTINAIIYELNDCELP